MMGVFWVKRAINIPNAFAIFIAFHEMSRHSPHRNPPHTTSQTCHTVFANPVLFLSRTIPAYFRTHLNSIHIPHAYIFCTSCSALYILYVHTSHESLIYTPLTTLPFIVNALFVFCNICTKLLCCKNILFFLPCLLFLTVFTFFPLSLYRFLYILLLFREAPICKVWSLNQ